MHPRLLRSRLLAALTLLLGLAPAADAHHDGRFDPVVAWPLCGRIADAPPRGWHESDGCPRRRWGDAAFADVPISSTFGPRRLPSERYRYDFHRGIDLAAVEGTPIFAIADGFVRIAGPHVAYRDPLIELRHLRPGHASCAAGGGCYFSDYLHVSDWRVEQGQRVSKGELIGYTGTSSSGFPHLHFEIRDAPADDPLSAWQRDAVHPLHALPYRDPEGDVELAIEEVRREDERLVVKVRVVQQPSALDLKRVRVRVLDVAGAAPVEIDQPGDVPDAHGYPVSPPWFDVDDWNRAFTHKDSQRLPWTSFAAGGERPCPLADAHSAGYAPNVHMDAAFPGDRRRGLLNGVALAPEHFNARKSEFVQRFTFRDLRAPADPEATRVVVEIENVAGRRESVAAGAALPPPGRRSASPILAFALLVLLAAAPVGLLLVRRGRRSGIR